MRGLRVAGVDGANLLLVEPGSDLRFSLPIDDRLRAAIGGPAEKLEQPVLEGESQLRPKEIQDRIRSGATVEEVAAVAGTSARRVETFAHPVLLERATVAEKARKARPAIDGITASAGVEETVLATLSGRGHEGELSWDAFKQDNDWVLALTWTIGRSQNRALWTYHRGVDGGTLTARNEAATEVVDPALKVLRPLRELRPEPPRRDAVTDTLLDPTLPTVQAPSSAADRERQERLVEDTVTDQRSGARTDDRARKTESAGSAEPAVVARTGTDHAAPTSHHVSQARPPAAPQPTAPASSASGPAKGKRGSRPAMPSWEDVLIGTRSTRQ